MATSSQDMTNNSTMSGSVPARILIVDDEDIIRILLNEILNEEGYHVTDAEDGEQAVALIEKEHFDLIISDMVMPGMNGIEVLQAAFRTDPEYAVVMITGYPSVETAVRLVKLGASDYITKPFNVDLIKVTVAKVLAMKRSRGNDPGVGTSDKVSAIDSSTDAYSAQIFTRMLHNEVARSVHRQHDLGLLVLEIDNFESYTAKGGVDAGELHMANLAKAIRQVWRPGDVMGRLDSAQIALLLPETGHEEAEPLAQKIRKSVEWSFTVSCGIVCVPKNTDDPEVALKTALAAVQAAKSRGGDAVLMPK